MKQRKLLRICYMLLLLPHLINGDEILESELDYETDNTPLISDDEKIPESEHEFPKENIQTRPDYRGPGHWATPAPESGIKLGFVPIKMYAQVRRSNTVKHLPRSDALASATSPEEIANAPRLREVVSSKKIQEVYTEEGYEDSAYDHGGFEKEASDGEGYEHREDYKRKPRRHFYRDSESQGSQLQRLKIGKDGNIAPLSENSYSLPKIKQRIIRKEKHSMNVEKKGEDGVPKKITAEYSYSVRPSNTPSLNIGPRLPQVTYQQPLLNLIQPHISEDLSEKSYQISTNMKLKPIDIPVKVPAPFLVPPSANPLSYKDISAPLAQSRRPHYATDSPIEGLIHGNVLPTNSRTYYPPVLPYTSGIILVPQDVSNGQLNILKVAPSSEQIVINNVPYLLQNDVLREYVEPANINLGKVSNSDSKNITQYVQKNDTFLQSNKSFSSQSEQDIIPQDQTNKNTVTVPVPEPEGKNPTKAQYVSDLTMSHFGNFPNKIFGEISVTGSETERQYPTRNQRMEIVDENQGNQNTIRSFSSTYLPFPPSNWPFDKLQRRMDDSVTSQEHSYSRSSNTMNPTNFISSERYNVEPENISKKYGDYSVRNNVFSDNINDTAYIEASNYSDAELNLKKASNEGAEIYLKKNNISRSDNYVEESGIGNPKYLSAEDEERKLQQFEEEVERNKEEELREKEQEWEEALKLADDGVTTVKPIDRKKYPFYFDSSSNIAPLHSAIRYATNPDLVPDKTEGGMEFYESRDSIHCPDVSPKLDVVPKRKAAGQWNKKPKPPLPRLFGLGDKIDCLRAKYFGVDPLDNPFFKDSEVEGSENKRSIEADDTELFYGEIMEKIRAVQHANNFPELKYDSYIRSPYTEQTASSNHNVKKVRVNAADTVSINFEENVNNVIPLEKRMYNEDGSNVNETENEINSTTEIQYENIAESKSYLLNSEQNAPEDNKTNNNIKYKEKLASYNERPVGENEDIGFFSTNLFKEEFKQIPNMFFSFDAHSFDKETENFEVNDKRFSVKGNVEKDVKHTEPCATKNSDSRIPECILQQNSSDAEYNLTSQSNSSSHSSKTRLSDKILASPNKIFQYKNEELQESDDKDITRVVNDMLSEETSVYNVVVNSDGNPITNYQIQSHDQVASNSGVRESHVRKRFTKGRLHRDRSDSREKDIENPVTETGEKIINTKLANNKMETHSHKGTDTPNITQSDLKKGRRLVRKKDMKLFSEGINYRDSRKYPHVKISNTNYVQLEENKNNFLEPSNHNFIQNNNATFDNNIYDNAITEANSGTIKEPKNSKENVNKGLLRRGTPFTRVDVRRGEPRYENLDVKSSSTLKNNNRRRNRNDETSPVKLLSKTHLKKDFGKQKNRLINRQDYDYYQTDFHHPEEFVDYDYEITQDGSQFFEQRQPPEETVNVSKKNLSSDKDRNVVDKVENTDDSLTPEEINRILGGFISRHKPTFSSRYNSKENITIAKINDDKNISSVEKTTSNPIINKTEKIVNDNMSLNITNTTENNTVSGRRQRKPKKIHVNDTKQNSTEHITNTHLRRRRPTDKTFSRQIETTTQSQDVQTFSRKRHRIRLTTRQSTTSAPVTSTSITTTKSSTVASNKLTTPYTVKKKPGIEKSVKDNKNSQTTLSRTTKGRPNKITARYEDSPGKATFTSTDKVRNKPKQNLVQTPFHKKVPNSDNSDVRDAHYKGRDPEFVGSLDYNQPSQKTEYKVTTTASSPRNVAVEHRRVTKEEFFTRTYIPEEGLVDDLIQDTEIEADNNSGERDDRSKKSTKPTDVIEDIYEPYETLQYKRKQLPESIHHYTYEPHNEYYVDRSDADTDNDDKKINYDRNKDMEKNRGRRKHKPSHSKRKSTYNANDKSIDPINDEELLYIRKPRRKIDAVRTDSPKSERDALFVERALESLSRQTLANKSPDGIQDDVIDTGERTLSYIVDTETGIGKWVPSRDANRKKGTKKLSTLEKEVDVSIVENDENERITNISLEQTNKKESRVEKVPRSKKGSNNTNQQSHMQESTEIVATLADSVTEKPEDSLFIKNARKKVIKNKPGKLLVTKLPDEIQTSAVKIKLKSDPRKFDSRTSVGNDKNVISTSGRPNKKTNDNMKDMLNESRGKQREISGDTSLMIEGITEVNIYRNPVTTVSIKRGKVRRLQPKKAPVSNHEVEDLQITESEKIPNEETPMESEVYILSKIMNDSPPAKRTHVQSISSSAYREKRIPDTVKLREVRQNGRKITIKNPEDRLYFYVQYQPN